MENMENVYKAETIALRNFYKTVEPKICKLEQDKQTLINVLLKHKPELSGWIKLNFGENK